MIKSIEILIHCDITSPFFIYEIAQRDFLTHIKRVFKKGGVKVCTQTGNLQIPFFTSIITSLFLVLFIFLNVFLCFNIFSYKFYPIDKNVLCVNLKIFIAIVFSLHSLKFLIFFSLFLIFPRLKMLPYTYSFLKIAMIINYYLVQSRM